MHISLKSARPDTSLSLTLTSEPDCCHVANTEMDIVGDLMLCFCRLRRYTMWSCGRGRAARWRGLQALLPHSLPEVHFTCFASSPPFPSGLQHFCSSALMVLKLAPAVPVLGSVWIGLREEAFWRLFAYVNLMVHGRPVLAACGRHHRLKGVLVPC